MNIIDRRIWDKNNKKRFYIEDAPKRIVIHHSYSPTAEEYNGVNTIKGILDYHESLEWADIGYHYIISPDGMDVYVGRPDNVRGAHCGNRPGEGVRRNFGNADSIGICLIGNYDTEEPRAEALATIIELLRMLSDKYKIDLKNVYGHCECLTKAPKTCPGKNLFITLFGQNRWKALNF